VVLLSDASAFFDGYVAFGIHFLVGLASTAKRHAVRTHHHRNISQLDSFECFLISDLFASFIVKFDSKSCGPPPPTY
jgi:hypothetical protein